MEFVIRKNATLPVLKMQVVKDGRGSYEDFMRFIETSTIYFSMQNVKTGAIKINSAFGGFVEKEFIEPNATPEYYLYYRFTKKDTNKPGLYEGQFMLKNELGTLILPIREKLNILIEDSLLEDDLDYNECYVGKFKCCIINPTPTPTPTITLTPSFTPSPTPSSTFLPTPTPSQTPNPILPPADDFSYLIIPDNDLGFLIISNNDLTYSIIVDNDLGYSIIADNDFNYLIISDDDTSYVIIPDNDFVYVLIPDEDILYTLIPDYDLNYVVIPSNDFNYEIINCTGGTYTLVTLPYEPPASGNTIFPGFTYGFGQGITNPNTFDADGIYWNIFDNKGVDQLSYYSGLTDGPFVISFSQNGDTAIYSGESGSIEFIVVPFPPFESVFYHDLMSNPSQPLLTLIQPSLNDFVEGQDVCISFYNLPSPPPPAVQRILYYDTNNINSYSGTSVIYDLENNSNGDIFNSPISGDTGCGSYLNFDGTNQYIVTQTDLTNKFTGVSPNISTLTSIFMWIYPTGDGVILTELGQPSVAGDGWHDVQIEMVSGTLKFGMWNGSSISSIVSSIPTPYNDWYYIGMVYDGTFLTAYVGGSQAGQVSLTRQTPYNNDNALYYGMAPQDITNMGDGSYGNFRIGSFEIYNGALTPTEVLDNYTSGQTQWICPTPTPTPTPSQTPNPPSLSYRYLRWTITKKRASGDFAIQAANLVLVDNGTISNWNVGATAVSPDSSYATPTESAQKLVDLDENTKWCDIAYGVNQVGLATIYFDNGFNITFNSYYYTTGNDLNERDPISWTIEVSDDNTNWILIDTVVDAIITTDRYTPTQIFNVSLPVTPTPTPSITPSETPTQTPTPSITPSSTPQSVVGSLFEMSLFESGSDVIMSGTGQFNITDLTFGFNASQQGLIRASQSIIIAGTGFSSVPCDVYSGLLIVPSNFGIGGQYLANSGSGDIVGIFWLGPGDYRLIVPTGYVSNTTLTTQSTFAGKTLSSLGCTPGTYTYSWGSGINSGSLVLIIGN